MAAASLLVGIAHHLGWAVAVTATHDHEVVDRRRLELIEPGVPASPVEHDLAGLDDAAAAALVAGVRASVVRATSAALDELASDLPAPIGSLSIRFWPPDFPVEISVLRRPPYDSRADSVLYLEVLAEAARSRGWSVDLYDHRSVERQAAAVLGARADDVLHGPRARLGPPWGKDQRLALAATVLAAD
jgi:hypothetical protein